MLKILHVDDEKDIRSIAKLTLESLGGYQVVSCGSGQEALEIAEETAPDLIILDVMMPEMDGPATMRQLREISALADTPVIFMTAKTQGDEIDSLIDIGAIGVIAKPFNPMQLSEEVNRVWSAHAGGSDQS